MASIQLRNVTKAYGKVVTLKNINLTIEDGELAVFVGPSGCGKSTMLRMIAGLEEITDGELLIDNEVVNDVTPADRGVAMVFQSYALYPHMTVAENMAYSLKIHKVPKDEIEKEVLNVAKALQIEHLLDRKPKQLSGGQRQRVALARSLDKEPRLLLLDEPMGALDKKLREQMRLELVDIINSVGVTCLMVTHDQEEAMTMADRIAIMDRGEFVQIGGPREIYENPNCKFSAEFIGSVNMFECTLTTSSLERSIIACNDFERPIELQHDIDIADGMPLSIALRPEKVYISHEEPEEETNWCSGIVENIAYLGDISIYYVRLPSGRIITSTLPNVDRFKVGLPTWDDRVYLSWDPESCIALTF